MKECGGVEEGFGMVGKKKNYRGWVWECLRGRRGIGAGSEEEVVQSLSIDLAGARDGAGAVLRSRRDGHGACLSYIRA